MKDLLLIVLKAYVKRNKYPPQELICFQNTSPGDQISMYQTLFAKQFKEMIKEAYAQEEIALTVVMVNVKTNERFFSEKDKKAVNPPAGTLIAKGLVSDSYDFYLISQYANKGSTVPNHYKVIYCDSQLEEADLQEIAFSQCFNYVNWTGSIKVPSILQYAKKSANFVSEVLQGSEVPESLTSRLYYV